MGLGSNPEFAANRSLTSCVALGDDSLRYTVGIGCIGSSTYKVFRTELCDLEGTLLLETRFAVSVARVYLIIRLHFCPILQP